MVKMEVASPTTRLQQCWSRSICTHYTTIFVKSMPMWALVLQFLDGRELAVAAGGKKKRKEEDEMQILLGTERKDIWSKDANSPIISGNGKV